MQVRKKYTKSEEVRKDESKEVRITCSLVAQLMFDFDDNTPPDPRGVQHSYIKSGFRGK